ncbi:MAG: hypothetical protein K0V04_01415 [Deltaproteobacteria bacterium]|nr:hypothetical protein [Deltaproteobacteria bacterium]
MTARFVARPLLALCIPLALAGCGALDDAVGGIRGWFGDEPAEPQVAVAAEGGAPVAGTTTAAQPVAAASDGSAGSAGTTRSAPASAGTTDGGASGATGGDSTTLLPMSYDRPLTGTGGDSAGGSGASSSGGTGSGGTDSGGTDSGGTGSGGTDAGGAAGSTSGAGAGEASGTTGGGATTGGAPPPPASVSECLKGDWVAQDVTGFYRRHVRHQTIGRRVVRRGASGRFTLRFDGSTVEARAEKVRVKFAARLADNDIRYTITLRGETVAPFAVEGTDTLVVRTASRNTMRARETVEFPGERQETRGAPVPVRGRLEAVCTPTDLSLRARGAKGTLGPAIRFVRPPV